VYNKIHDLLIKIYQASANVVQW